VDVRLPEGIGCTHEQIRRTRPDSRGVASVKAYLDNDLVSGFRKRDLKLEDLAAMTRLKGLADEGRISLVVSAIHDDEAAPLAELYR
jgi:hypothetical protein